MKTNPKNLFVGTEDLFFTLFGTLADTNDKKRKQFLEVPKKQK